MSAHPTPTTSGADPGQPAADAQYYRRVLHELIDIGADLARQLHRHATAPAEAAPPANDPHADPAPDAAVAVAFDRIARCVRRTILLAHKIAEPARPGAARDPGPNAEQHRVAARKQIIREVEDAIGRNEQGARAGALHAELLDRLDAPDLDDDIVHRPVADIIADIERDLGLAAIYGASPWKRRTPGDVEQLRTRAARLAAGARPAAPPDAEDAIASNPRLSGASPARAPRRDTQTAVIPCRKDAAPTGAGSDPPAQRDDRPILLPYANRLRNP